MKKLLFLLLAISCLATFGWSQSNSPKIIRTASVVATPDLIQQKPLFIPETDGLFRVSSYTELITPESDGAYRSLCGYIGWTDDSPVPETISLFTTPCVTTISTTAGDEAEGVVVLHAKAGTPVTIQTKFEGPSGQAPGFTYSLFITVEKLD